MSNAKGAFGTVLARNGNNVAELTKIGSPQRKGDTVEVTSHDSANGYREFIAGLKDGGEFAVAGNFIASDANGQIGLSTDLDAGTVQTFTITFPVSTGTVWSFSAIVTGFAIDDAEPGNALTFTASFKITGKPSLAVSTSTGLTTPFFAISNSAVINPAPAGNVYSYVATVLTGVTSVTVTPTATAGTIVVAANGASQTVASGVASSAITLGSAGSVTTITITVTESNKAPRTYTIYLSRP